MNIELVVCKLTELSSWLGGLVGYQKMVDEAIKDLLQPDLSGIKLRQLKHTLSQDVLFHSKCLGDVYAPIYIPKFPGDGTNEAWLNYLKEVEKICQDNL